MRCGDQSNNEVKIMRIKEFNITRYGPLPNTGQISLHDFNLFFGKNEDGKTLTIDALVKLLLRQNIRAFPKDINRVEEMSDGFVILLDKEGREIKLPEKGDLTKFTDLTPSECRNIFIVRNSDLSIARDAAQESKFYTNLMDRLMGLKTVEISKIKENLREIGKIRPKEDEFRDIKDEKLKTRMKGAKELIEKIEELSKEIKEKRFDELEEESVRKKEEKEKIKNEIEILDDARKREKYEKGKEALKKLREVKKSPEVEELRRKKRHVQSLHEKRDRIYREIMPKIDAYKTKKEEVAEQRPKDRFFTFMAIISLILLIICLIGSILTREIIRYSLVFIPLTILFLILSGISSYFKYKFRRKESQLAKEFERIKSNALELELTAENIEGILSNIQEFEEKYTQEKEELKEKEMKREKFIGKQKGILESFFGTKSGTSEENISYWDEKIKELGKYKDKARDIKYSDAAVLELKGKKDQLEKKLQEINGRMKSLQGEMERIEGKVNDILREDEHLYCKTSWDLKAIRDKLQVFIDKNENNKKNVLKAIKIFEKIETEEKEKFSELFGKDSPISEYFKEITDGLYEEVILNQEVGEIEVKCKDGEVLGAEKLSGGAYDQLYLSIRLALGEKLLKGEKGFFIMDDPFIKASQERLRRQVNMLKKISKQGWQIIYFTAKGEIKDALKDEIKEGNINYKEIQGIFS